MRSEVLLWSEASKSLRSRHWRRSDGYLPPAGETGGSHDWFPGCAAVAVGNGAGGYPPREVRLERAAVGGCVEGLCYLGVNVAVVE